jgi:hypothetical protein
MVNINSDPIDRLRIASPCPVGWEQMTGGERVRHCDLCSLKVYNIAQMSRTDAEALIANTEGRICARLFRRADGTVITKDCPVGLRAIRRRVARVAGAAIATILGLCGSVMGQKPNAKDACQQQVKITKKVADTASGATTVTGLVQDQNGAVVAGARISILDQKTGKSYDLESSDEGRFTIGNLPLGTYEIKIKRLGFKDLVVKDLAVAAKENVIMDAVLIGDETTVTVGILVSDEPLVDTSGPGITFTIKDERIRKLPIP